MSKHEELKLQCEVSETDGITIVINKTGASLSAEELGSNSNAEVSLDNGSLVLLRNLLNRWLPEDTSNEKV